MTDTPDTTDTTDTTAIRGLQILALLRATTGGRAGNAAIREALASVAATRPVAPPPPPPVQIDPTAPPDARIVAYLRALPSGHAGNAAIRQALGLDEDAYRAAVASLEGRDAVVRGRGRGGSLWLADAPGAPDLKPAKAPKGRILRDPEPLDLDPLREGELVRSLGVTLVARRVSGLPLPASEWTRIGEEVCRSAAAWPSTGDDAGGQRHCIFPDTGGGGYWITHWHYAVRVQAPCPVDAPTPLLAAQVHPRLVVKPGVGGLESPPLAALTAVKGESLPLEVRPYPGDSEEAKKKRMIGPCVVDARYARHVEKFCRTAATTGPLDPIYLTGEIKGVQVEVWLMPMRA